MLSTLPTYGMDIVCCFVVPDGSAFALGSADVISGSVKRVVNNRMILRAELLELKLEASRGTYCFLRRVFRVKSSIANLVSSGKTEQSVTSRHSLFHAFYPNFQQFEVIMLSGAQVFAAFQLIVVLEQIAEQAQYCFGLRASVAANVQLRHRYHYTLFFLP